MKIQTKRVYDPPAKSDGYRVLIDRIWPRGVAKAKLKCDLWLKEIAPSTGLRKWFDHDPKKWAEFRTRYFAELRSNADLVLTLIDEDHAVVTLIYAAKETRFNNAIALKSYLEKRVKHEAP